MSKFNQTNVVIIGDGHIGTALYDGWKKSGFDDTRLLLLGEMKLKKSGGYSLSAANGCSTIFIFAVPPKYVEEAVAEYALYMAENDLIISVAAGIERSNINHPSGICVLRIMPNVAVAFCKGIIGINGLDEYDQADNILSIFSLLGVVVRIEDHQMDVFTAFAGSGPAFVAEFILKMVCEVEKHQLTISPRVVGKMLTGIGAVLEEGTQNLEAYKNSIATKGGVTAAGVLGLNEDKNLSRSVENCFTQALDRCDRLKVLSQIQPEET